MQNNADDQILQKSLDDIVRDARKQLSERPLYIVLTEHGYHISDAAPQVQHGHYRVNVDGTTTLLVPDSETNKLMELPGHPASYPNMTTSDLKLNEDKPANN